jgi:hypothetical protein
MRRTTVGMVLGALLGAVVLAIATVAPAAAAINRVGADYGGGTTLEAINRVGAD